VELILKMPLEELLWEGEISVEAKPEELPVKYIVVRPARDG